jgi:hypothetical protein
VFYWAALAGDGNRTADNIMKHGTNNILIFLDVILSRVPFLSYHFWVGTWLIDGRAQVSCRVASSQADLLALLRTAA